MQMYEKAEIIPPDSVCTACGCQEVTVRLFLGRRLSLWSLDNMLLHFCISYTDYKKSGRLTCIYTHVNITFAQIHSVNPQQSRV